MPARVLVVDDDALLRFAICAHIECGGLEALEAAAAEAALERILNERVDLLVTDILLPDRSGLWLMEEARRRRGRGLPVVIVTGWFPDQEQLVAYRSADAVLPKPVRFDELVRRVVRLVEARGAGRATR